MPYKVFFVEDEIQIREGIRDSVDWRACGFEFCGEAPDGELALPLLLAAKPDVLITDIRMPFMDGLQLTQIVHDRLPSTKVIILSGHDEFEYAQKAIKLGVFEYLLKPVSMQELVRVLRKVAEEIAREEDEQQALQRLQNEIELNRAALRERFLLRLVTGAALSGEALASSQSLGIDLIARVYLVVMIRVQPLGQAEPDLRELLRVQQLASTLVDRNPDAFLLRRDTHDLVLLLKGHSAENLQEERDLLLARMRQDVEAAGCELIVATGTPQSRVTDINRSFLDAWASFASETSGRQTALSSGFDETGLLEVDKSVVENYLRTGSVQEFDSLFETLSRPLHDKIFASHLAKSYVITDIVLSTARFVEELGGSASDVVPELGSIEPLIAAVVTMDQLRAVVRKILSAGLAYRDSQVARQYAGIIKLAQDYIDSRYMQPDLSLNDVAARVKLSPGHFSTVFSQETRQTFKEYLTELRMKKAKELLRTTTLKAFEIGYEVGYSDPHYFSHVFHKNTGLTPMEFRLLAQAG